MNVSFYTAAVGAQQQQERLNVHANNIANVNNYGFRARIPAFSSLMTGLIDGIDADLPRGVGSKLEDAELDQRTTGYVETGRALDYAIEGDGFFALYDPNSNTYYYTREGSFTMSEYYVESEEAKEWENGVVRRYRLSDGMGRFVVGSNGRPVELTGTEDTQAPGDPLPIGVFDFLNRNGMDSFSESRMSPVDKNGQVGIGAGTLKVGVLELSNTDLAYELSKVIESQRSFSYMLRMVTTSDEIETTVNSLR